MSLTPTQLQELQTIVLDLGEEFPHNADALWNAAIRIQTGGLGPTSGAGGQPAFDAAVADIKLCQEEVQTYQQRQGSPSSGFDVAVLQVVPATSTFPSGNVGEILYLDIAPNNYVATDQIVIDPVGPNSVQMDEVGTTVFRTVPAASGGIEINNLATGGGFERVLTTADSQAHNAEFVTLALSANIPNERVLTAGTDISIVDGGAGGNVTINADSQNPFATPLGIVGTGVVVPTAGTPYDYDAQLEFQNANLLQTATVGWNGTSNFQVRSAAREALVELIGTDTTGVERTLFSGDPDGVTILRYGLLATVDGGVQISAPDADTPFRITPMLGAVPVADFIDYNTDRDDWEIRGDVEFTDNPATNRTVTFNTDVIINGADRFIQAPLTIGNASNHGSTGSGDIYFVSDTGVNRGLFLGRQFFAQNLTDKGASQFGAVFDTNTSMVTDPGTYNLRFDNATPASVTEISIDDTGIGGHDFGDYWGAELVSGDRLFIKQVDDDTRWIIFTLTGPPVDQTGFWTIPVSVSSSGVLPVDTEEINVEVFLASLGGGQVNSVVGGTNISVNVADPINPIVNLDAAITGVSVNAVTLSAAGAATNFLNEAGGYTVPAGGIGGSITDNQVAVGATIANDIEGSTALTFDAGLLEILSTAPILALRESSAGVDEKLWYIGATSVDRLIFQTRTDAGGAGEIFLNVQRIGTAVQQIEIPQNVEIRTGHSLAWFDAGDGDSVSVEINTTTMSPAEALVFTATANVEVYSFDEDINVDNGSVHIGATQRFALYRFGDSVSNFINNNSGELTGTSVAAAFRFNALSLRLLQTSAPDTNVANYGQIWVDNEAPTRLRYTDDTDDDFVVAISGGQVGGNVTVNNSFNFNTAGNFADNWIGQYFDGGNDTITLEDSGSQVNWPLYTTINIIAPGSGVLTVTEGSGVTLFNADGSDTVGGVTISQGVASITRQSASNYIVWGSGIT